VETPGPVPGDQRNISTRRTMGACLTTLMYGLKHVSRTHSRLICCVSA
jgi:hypothetical protein